MIGETCAMIPGPFAKFSKYRVVTRLGSGGMAEVYLVMSERPGGFSKLQVLKLMRSDLTELERPEFLQMFQDEARLAARLNHPNIVQSFEVGAENGQPYIVMEFLEGQSLHRVQQRARHLGRGFATPLELFVLCQVLEGLEYAHGLTDYAGNPLHIVHRDVSPQNVFITYSGQTKLVDFGVAKTLESSKTRAGVVKGKVAYMAPEQVTSSPIDQRADLFSVGVLLWEAIAQQPMHAELTVYESMSRLVRGQLPRLRDTVPDLHPELERIVARALALSPADRYQDAESFRAELFGHLEATSKVRARDVGDAVAQLFAREREQLHEVIRGVSTSTPPPAAVEQPASGRVITRRIPEADDPSSDATTASPLETPVHRESEVVSTPHKTRKPSPAVWFGGLAALAIFGVTALLIARLPEDETATLPATNGNTPERAVPVPAEPPAPIPDIEVAIDVEPKDATLVLDGRTLEQNPYRAHLASDAREHVLSVSAPGYRSQSTILSYASDVKLELALEKVPAEPQPVKAEPPRPNKPRAATKGSEAEKPDDSADPYIDLPAPKRSKRPVPELDRNDPWQSDPAR